MRKTLSRAIRLPLGETLTNCRDLRLDSQRRSLSVEFARGFVIVAGFARATLTAF